MRSRVLRTIDQHATKITSVVTGFRRGQDSRQDSLQEGPLSEHRKSWKAKPNDEGHDAPHWGFPFGALRAYGHATSIGARRMPDRTALPTTKSNFVCRVITSCLCPYPCRLRVSAWAPSSRAAEDPLALVAESVVAVGELPQLSAAAVYRCVHSVDHSLPAREL